jgi:hypothetical protein
MDMTYRYDTKQCHSSILIQAQRMSYRKGNIIIKELADDQGIFETPMMTAMTTLIQNCHTTLELASNKSSGGAYSISIAVDIQILLSKSKSKSKRDPTNESHRTATTNDDDDS